MKFNKYIFKALAVVPVLMLSCTYDFPEADPATIPSKGTADFTKFVSVGNSLTAGFMDGALYTRSQNNSFPSIMATQFALVDGGEFNQPTINSENGCYNPAGGCNQGRLHFAYVSGSATILPKTGDGGVALQAYAGAKAELNNFGVPGVTIQTAQAAAIALPASGALFNPYYARIASNPGTSTLIGDAVDAMENGGTFFSFWLGNNDVLGYATGGASNPAILTSEANFLAAYTAAINAMLGANTNAKGVVANIPDVTTIPYFTRVPHNAIPLNATVAGQLNAGYATFNGGIDAYNAGMLPGQTEAPPENLRRPKINFAAGQNAIVIIDEHLPDLSAYNIPPIRQATANDLICLPASSILGVDAGSGPQGLQDPLKDNLVLTATEIVEVKGRTNAFNTIIANAVSTNNTRLALVDAHTILTSIRATPILIGGIALTSSFEPPYGLFSADGVHPNGRGSAFMANKFLEAINTKFNANIPLVNPNDYPGNDLPVNP